MIQGTTASDVYTADEFAMEMPVTVRCVDFGVYGRGDRVGSRFGKGCDPANLAVTSVT